jgi:hypothetical protein
MAPRCELGTVAREITSTSRSARPFDSADRVRIEVQAVADYIFEIVRRWNVLSSTTVGMTAMRKGRILIGRGRDASDVAMVTTSGGPTLHSMNVITHEQLLAGSTTADHCTIA